MQKKMDKMKVKGYEMEEETERWEEEEGDHKTEEEGEGQPEGRGERKFGDEE
jgi:hypothetical protein